MKEKPARAAVAKRDFPPVIKYPEKQADLLSTWFLLPTIVWVPECLSRNKKPVCIVDKCPCEPKIKQYMERTVEDVEHKTTLYYARYVCTGIVKRAFSTIDDDYLASSKLFLLTFPYLLTHQSGVSSSMFDMVYESMLTTKGIAGAVSNVARRRQKRYLELLSRAAVAVESRRSIDAEYEAFLPPSYEQYIACHSCLDAETLMDIWLSQTEICSHLFEAQMADTVCNRVIRLDHSQTFCSKLKQHGSDNSKTQPESIRLLLLVQNEVGQIMSRALTYSENHVETRAVLELLRDRVDASDPTDPRVCVCDNANANRKLIESAFGTGVVVKQDPFHVILRFTEKIRDPAKRKWLAGQISGALYDTERNLRPPAEMEQRDCDALAKNHISSVSVREQEWAGCMASNIEQIRAGDVYVSENQYCDEGGSTQVLSTSQLEAVHPKLRKLLDRVVSVQVGLRILDIFLLQHNLKTGASRSRNPVFLGFDFLTLSRTAILCKDQLPDTPQTEYIHKLLAWRPEGTSAGHRYRPGGEKIAGGRPWERLYVVLPLNVSRAEAAVLAQRTNGPDIRDYLVRTHVKSKSLTKEEFAAVLGLEPEYDALVSFSADEFALLKLLRSEQVGPQKTWYHCAVVATVMYDAAVLRLGENPRLDIRKRGLRAVSKRLDAVDEQIGRQSRHPDPLFELDTKKLNDGVHNPDEKALLEHIFNMLRDSPGVKKRKQVYFSIYDFASCVCPNIYPKSHGCVMKWWN